LRSALPNLKNAPLGRVDVGSGEAEWTEEGGVGGAILGGGDNCIEGYVGRLCGGVETVGTGFLEGDTFCAGGGEGDGVGYAVDDRDSMYFVFVCSSLLGTSSYSSYSSTTIVVVLLPSNEPRDTVFWS
jgi:hypothetical protein